MKLDGVWKMLYLIHSQVYVGDGTNTLLGLNS